MKIKVKGTNTNLYTSTGAESYSIPHSWPTRVLQDNKLFIATTECNYQSYLNSYMSFFPYNMQETVDLVTLIFFYCQTNMIC
jgi:hypothetical protein